MEVDDSRSWANIAAIEYFQGSPGAKKITCKLCRQLVFSINGVAPDDKLRQELLGVQAHYEIHHGIQVRLT